MKPLVPFLVLVALVACGRDRGPLTPEDAKALVLEAAEIPRALLDEVTAAGHDWHPGTASTLPFSMLLLSVPFPDSEDLRRIPTPGEAPLTPRQLWLDAGSGRITLLTGEHITELTVEEEAETAAGSFRFRRPNVAEGRATFRARRTEGGWEVVELGLPAVDAAVARRRDGTWGIIEGR